MQSKRLVLPERRCTNVVQKKFYKTMQTATEKCKKNQDLAAILFDFIQNLQLLLLLMRDLFYTVERLSIWYS